MRNRLLNATSYAALFVLVVFCLHLYHKDVSGKFTYVITFGIAFSVKLVFDYTDEVVARWWRKFSCSMGWHSPAFRWKRTRHDGVSQHAVCPWCNYEGMIDSQGNLF
jgi:hypothetical protein